MYVDDRRAYADKKTTNDVCSHKHLHLEHKKHVFETSIRRFFTSFHFITMILNCAAYLGNASEGKQFRIVSCGL